MRRTAVGGLVMVALVIAACAGADSASPTSIHAHVSGASSKAADIFAGVASMDNLDPASAGGYGQLIVKWANEEDDYLAATEFPGCLDDLESRWGEIVAGIRKSGQALVHASEGDSHALDTWGEDSHKIGEMESALARDLPGMYATC